MTRLYYDCPIKALYMMREFGVKIEQWKFIAADHEPELEDVQQQEMIQEFHDYNIKTYKEDFFYISKESEHIFEPQHDDLGLTEKDLLPCIFNYKNNWMGLSIVGDCGIREDENCLITMRNNKQFFQPLTEE